MQPKFLEEKKPKISSHVIVFVELRFLIKSQLQTSIAFDFVYVRLPIGRRVMSQSNVRVWKKRRGRIAL